MAIPTMGSISTSKASGATSLTSFIVGDRVKFRLTNCSFEFVQGYTKGYLGDVLRVGGAKVVGGGTGNTVVGVTSGQYSGTIISQSAANTGATYYGDPVIRITFTVEITYNVNLTAGSVGSFAFVLFGLPSSFSSPNDYTSVSGGSASFTVYAYSQPSISSANLVRCDSSGNETTSGTYLKFRAYWSVATGIPGLTSSATFRWGASSPTSSAISVSSGSWSSPFGSGSISPFSSYMATVTVTDNANGSASQTANVGNGTYIDPSITSVELVRCNSAGTITGIGTYLKFRAYWNYMAVGGNSITATFTWSSVGGSQSSSISMSNGAWSSPLGAGAIDIKTNYQATGYISASLGGSDSRIAYTAATNYVNPTVVIEAVRCDSAGNPSDLGGYLKARGTYSFASVGGSNSASATFTWNQVGGTQSAPIALPANNAWSAPFGAGAISIINTYYIYAQVTDAVGNIGTNNYTVGPVGYDPPQITDAEAVRCDSLGNPTDSGTYIKVRVNYTYSPMGGANTAKATFVWGLQGGEMSEPNNLSNNVWSAPIGAGSIDQFASYVVVISVADTFLMSDMETIYLMSAGFTGEYWGFVSSSLSDHDNTFQEPVPLSVVFTQPVNIKGLHFTFNVFDDSYCNNMSIRFVHDSGPDTIVNAAPDAAVYLLDLQESNVTSIQMTLYSMNKPDRFLWIQKLVFGSMRVFTRDEIVTCNTYSELEADGSDLKIGTLSFEVFANDIEEASFGRRKKTELFYNSKLIGTYFIDDLDFTQSNTWSFRCVDAVGVLEDSTFDGGKYNGNRIYTQSASNTGFIVNDISRFSGVPITVSDDFVISVSGNGTKNYLYLYGVLQVCKCRYALVQVAFAIGAIIVVNPNGSIHLKMVDANPTAHFDAQRIMVGAHTKKEKLSVENVSLTVRRHSYKDGEFTVAAEKVGDLVQATLPTRIYLTEPVNADDFFGGFAAGYGSIGATPPAGQFVVPIEMNANFFGYTTSATLSGWSLFALKLIFTNEIMTKTNSKLLESENKTNIDYDRYVLSLARSPYNVNAMGNGIVWDNQYILDRLFSMAVQNKRLFSTVILQDEALGDTVSVDVDLSSMKGSLVDIRFVAAREAVNFDYIDTKLPVAKRYEAEDGILKFCQVDATNANLLSNGKQVAYYSKLKSSELTFVGVPGETSAIDICYNNGGAEAEVDMYINDVYRKTITLPYTGMWSNAYKTVTVDIDNGSIKGVVTKMNTNFNNCMISQVEVRH